MFGENPNWMDRIWYLARFLLFPTVLVAVFLQFGFNEFCVAALAIWLTSLIYRLAIERKAYRSMSEWTIVATPALFGMTLYTHEPFFAQILPTIYSGNILVFSILSLWPSLPTWLKSPYISSSETDGETAVTVVLGIVVLGGINEIVRVSASLEVWVLFYSFRWWGLALVGFLLVLLREFLRALMLAIANAFRS